MKFEIRAEPAIGLSYRIRVITKPGADIALIS